MGKKARSGMKIAKLYLITVRMECLMGRRRTSTVLEEKPIRFERWTNPNRPPIQLECERQLRAEGFQPLLWMDPPGQVWHDFGCEADYFIWVLSGTARVTLRGKVVDLAAGDRLFIPVGSVYSLENTGSSKLVWLAGLCLKSSQPSVVSHQQNYIH